MMTRIDVIDLLERCAEFLDNYVDVNDGEDGQPRPNRAMQLATDVEAAIERLINDNQCDSVKK